MRKTTVLKPAEVTRTWYVVDASKAPLGRISTRIAAMLIGKNKPLYSPHVDSGDYVVVINADKLVVTGDKLLQKHYYRHSQYPGSLKDTTLEAQIEKDAAKVIEMSVKGMLPKNKLQSGRMARLKVYNGSDHNHAPQKPVELNIGDKK